MGLSGLCELGMDVLIFWRFKTGQFFLVEFWWERKREREEGEIGDGLEAISGKVQLLLSHNRPMLPLATWN